MGSNSAGTILGNDIAFTTATAPISIAHYSLDATGKFHLAFDGQADAKYSVWASTNLTNWTQLGATTQVSPGSFLFDDAAATNYPTRFYRILWP